MIKRILFAVFIAAAIGGTIFAYFYLKSAKKPKTSVLEIIPGQVDFLMECDNLFSFTQKITENNLIWEELCQEPFFASLNDDLLYIDSIASSKDDYKSFFKENRIYFVGKKDATFNNYMLAFNLQDINQGGAVITFLKTNCSVFESIKTPKSNEPCYKIQIKNRTSTLYAYCNNGLVMLCNSLEFIERSISNKGLSSLSTNKKFVELEEGGGNNMDTRIFIRNQYYRELLSPLCLQSVPIHADNSWTALDFDAQANEFRFNGFVESDSVTLFDALKTQEPVEQTFTKYCPKNTEAFYFLGINEPTNFSKQLSKTISLELQSDIDELAKLTDAGLYNEWADVTNGEIVLVKTKINNVQQSFGVTCINDKDMAYKFLKQVSDTCVSLTAKHTDSLYHLSNAALFSAISSGCFADNFTSAYVYDNCIVFGKSDSLLKIYLDELLNFGSLSKSERFMQTTESNLNSACNFYFYRNFTKEQDEVQSYLNITTLSVFNKPKERLKKFGFFGIQLSAHKGKLLTQSCLHYNPISKEQNLTLWETALDTTSSCIPQVVINHKTDGKELFLSDDKGTIYLISNTGKIQWKKNLDDKIMSDVVQIDFFKNGKLQLLFNTQNAIHLIDRNGNYVNGYPIKLAAAATNPIAIFDYENTKDYRILVACDNKKVYNYSVNGNMTDGFNFPETKDIIVNKIEFKRIAGKDYLLAIDKAGNIYSTDRKGGIRLNFKNTMANNFSTFYYEEGKDLQKSKFYFADMNEAALKQLTLDDKLKSNQIETEIKSKNIQFSYINEDRLIDYILSDETGFEAFDDEGKKLISYVSKTDCKSPIKTITLDNSLYFLFIDANDHLQVIDVASKQVEEPIKKFSSLPVITAINSDAKLYALGIHKDKLNCYEFMIP